MADVEMALVKKDQDQEYSIKPEAVAPAVDTSQWPLLLKNWDRCKSPPAAVHLLSTSSLLMRCRVAVLVRTGHFTPIPHGCNPLRRDLKSYISSGVIK